jgi:hypothetical protein
MLSTEMPIHQLAKSGQEQIRIIRRPSGGGQASLYWKVEPNPAVGHPGPLAYRLDTWVIKRCLDRLRRPIPRLVRIGDLRQIARELGCGGDTNTVKRAFEQNASAFIRAKMAHKDADGRETWFEGYFNRYNVFFRGQALPGGARAETVYISLNDPYHGLLNNSVWRPLDYDYLRTLTPSAQRWYELVSPRIFAAIKNRRPTAWIRYSDFCVLAATKPQSTKQRMQSQMAVVHRPHLASRYLASVRWRTERSDDGSADWTIHYVPGPRAEAEFAAFNRPAGRGHALHGSRDSSSVPTQKRSHPPAALPEREEAPATLLLIRRFQERRHGSAMEVATPKQRARAAELLAALDGDVETASLAVDMAADEAKRARSGYPRHLGGILEGGFIERARALRDEAQRRGKADAELRRAEDQHKGYEAWSRNRAEERIAALSTEIKRQLVADRSSRVISDFEQGIRGWSEARVREWAERRVLARYGHEGEPTFEEWRRQHGAQLNDSFGPSEALQ